MRIDRFRAENFRNLASFGFEPGGGVNLIHGENGQGKTNIIEALWMFTGCQSFRTHRSSELIAQGASFAKIETDFFAKGRPQSALIRIENKREAFLNGVAQRTPRNLLGEFPAVVFSPDSLSVVKDGPSEKRRFMDIAVSQIKPVYAAVLSRYLKTLAQRNALLKMLSERRQDPRLLAAYDEQLAVLGGRLSVYRHEYIERLAEKATDIHRGISSGSEALKVRYLPCVRCEGGTQQQYADAIAAALLKNRESDIRRQMTSAGPHKDDLQVCINGSCARSYGSQGQQRSCALAMKLGEAAIIGESAGEPPVALLDDVMSELDAGRQAYVFGAFEHWQVFITCCDPSALLRAAKGDDFEIRAGALAGQTDQGNQDGA